MEPERHEHKGHHIELSAPDAAPDDVPTLLIDNAPVRYDQLPDGSYYLPTYAYDQSENLVDLAQKFLDYREKVDEVRQAYEAGGADGLAVRRNYRNLSNAERERFVEALHQVKSHGIVDQFASDHETFFHQAHHSSHFLPWHREFLIRFESALQEFHPDVTLPYWDSTLDTSPSDPLWADNFLGQFDSAWDLGRMLGSATLATAEQVRTTLGRDTYDAFWPELEVVIHNPPHNWVSGVMATAASPGDPVFYLHHAWIDLLWAQWQQTHPDAPFVSSGAGFGVDDPMQPWPDRTPAHVLDHHALGYRYDTE